MTVAGEQATDSGKATRRDSLRAARMVNWFCPGLGQLLIGRWLVGIIQLTLFGLAVAVGTGLGLLYIIRIYSTVIHAAGDSRAAMTAPDPRGLYAAFAAIGVALAVLLWSLWDLGHAAEKPDVEGPP